MQFKLAKMVIAGLLLFLIKVAVGDPLFHDNPKGHERSPATKIKR